MTTMALTNLAQTISHETIECIEELLRHAHAGDITGIVYGCTVKRRGYIVDSAGELYKNPTFARGVCAALDDHLGARIRHGKASG